MLKRILAIVFVLLIMASIFTGCSKSSQETAAPVQAVELDKAGNSQVNSQVSYDATVEVSSLSDQKSYGKTETVLMNENKADAKDGEANAVTASGSNVTTSQSPSQSVDNAILSQRKIIRNANVSVEVEKFDSAYMKLKKMIEAFGFVQESSIKTDKVYVDGKEKPFTRGTVIIRVDKDRFDSILSDIKGLGTLINENIKSDDVTDKFFDTESRLRLLRLEESKLEEYLKKTNDLDTIFKFESKLTDLRHEIESLTGTLKKWSDLVDLSTITVEMNEKTPDSKPAKEKSYWGKLADKFTGSVKGVVDFCGEFLIVLVQMLPALVLVGIMLLAAMLLYKKVFKKRYKLVANKKENVGEDKDNDTEE